MRPIRQTFVVIQKAIPPWEDLRELTGEVQQMASEREKQNWKYKD